MWEKRVSSKNAERKNVEVKKMLKEWILIHLIRKLKILLYFILFDKEKHRFIDSEDNVDEGEDEKGRVLS